MARLRNNGVVLGWREGVFLGTGRELGVGIW